MTLHMCSPMVRKRVPGLTRASRRRAADTPNLHQDKHDIRVYSYYLLFSSPQAAQAWDGGSYQ